MSITGEVIDPISVNEICDFLREQIPEFAVLLDDSILVEQAVSIGRQVDQNPGNGQLSVVPILGTTDEVDFNATYIGMVDNGLLPVINVHTHPRRASELRNFYLKHIVSLQDLRPMVVSLKSGEYICSSNPVECVLSIGHNGEVFIWVWQHNLPDNFSQVEEAYISWYLDNVTKDGIRDGGRNHLIDILRANGVKVQVACVDSSKVLDVLTKLIETGDFSFNIRKKNN